MTWERAAKLPTCSQPQGAPGRLSRKGPGRHRLVAGAQALPQVREAQAVLPE